MIQWKKFIKEEAKHSYFKALLMFLDKELKQYEIAPSGDFFKALNSVAIQNTKVVILGQDPYPTKGHANGLAFAVNKGVERPRSLENIFKEIESDIGLKPEDNTLLGWTQQGVLLLNTVLTCRIGEPASHRNKGWEVFTDKVIMNLNQKKEPIVFILWGKPAQDKRKLIASHHHVLMAAHPSPLSCHRGFFGCKHFSKANELLKNSNQEAINWVKTAKF